MLKNRDTSRKNRATLAVQGTMYGNLAIACMDSIGKSKATDNESSRYEDKVDELIKLAKDSALKSLEHFTSAQDQISKSVCSNYASDQHKQLMKAIENHESIDDIANVHKHVVNKEMVDMYKLLNKSDNEG